MKTTELIKKLAMKYERFKDMLPEISMNDIKIYRNDIEQAYDRLPQCLRVEFVDYEPYKDVKELSEDITVWAVMKVSSLNNTSDLVPGVINLKFRAVHDYFHYLLQQPFDFKGELNVYKAQKFQHTTDISKRILYSEIVYQTAYCTHYGKFPDKQKVII